ncbi:hypothetical protein MKY42_11700 [Paenibacillus sp. FSL W7-1088]|uniref:hypothetical protein n=1 Tax=Paenibacillus sp. FSL W7-1088 TaxID=2921695 RepID=UPI0030EDD805
MTVRKSPKLIKYFEHGELIHSTYEESETWTFYSKNFTFWNVNCTLMEAIDDLSAEGWELICKGEQGYILRKPAEKEEPQPLS